MTPDVLNRISEQFCNSSVLKRDRESLQTLVIHLICRSGSGAFNLLLFLLDTASGGQGSPEVKEGSKVNKMVQDTCALVLVSEINMVVVVVMMIMIMMMMIMIVTICFYSSLYSISKYNLYHKQICMIIWIFHIGMSVLQTKFATFSSLVTIRKKE